MCNTLICHHFRHHPVRCPAVMISLYQRSLLARIWAQAYKDCFRMGPLHCRHHLFTALVGKTEGAARTQRALHVHIVGQMHQRHGHVGRDGARGYKVQLLQLNLWIPS